MNCHDMLRCTYAHLCCVPAFGPRSCVILWLELATHKGFQGPFFSIQATSASRMTAAAPAICSLGLMPLAAPETFPGHFSGPWLVWDLFLIFVCGTKKYCAKKCDSMCRLVTCCDVMSKLRVSMLPGSRQFKTGRRLELDQSLQKELELKHFLKRWLPNFDRASNNIKQPHSHNIRKISKKKTVRWGRSAIMTTLSGAANFEL